jgi:putative acetyltransferase
MEDVIVRQETSEDIRAIDVVNLSAFQGDDEANFVTAIRQTPSFVPELSLVAEFGGRIVGHVLLFKVALVSSDGERNILALAPMSVVPSQSHRGIGSALVRAGVAKAGSLGYGGIVVIGHPDFYKRFGFENASKWGVRCPVSAPDEAVTAKELVAGGLEGGGTVRYPRSFVELFNHS